MLIRSYLIIFALLSTATMAHVQAQNTCAFETLVGEWKETLSAPGVQVNFDSLKNAASASGRNLGIWNFTTDKRYRYQHVLQRSKYKRKSVYTLDAKTCNIVLGTKPNAHERANLEILYLDNQYLIYKSDNNPKGYFTHVLVRYKKKSRKR